MREGRANIKDTAAPMPPSKSECIKVVARCRPLSESEAKDNRKCIVSVQPPDTVRVRALSTVACSMLMTPAVSLSQVEPDKAFSLDQVGDTAELTWQPDLIAAV